MFGICGVKHHADYVIRSIYSLLPNSSILSNQYIYQTHSPPLLIIMSFGSETPSSSSEAAWLQFKLTIEPLHLDIESKSFKWFHKGLFEHFMTVINNTNEFVLKNTESSTVKANTSVLKQTEQVKQTQLKQTVQRSETLLKKMERTYCAIGSLRI